MYVPVFEHKWNLLEDLLPDIKLVRFATGLPTPPSVKAEIVAQFEIRS